MFFPWEFKLKFGDGSKIIIDEKLPRVEQHD